jgi:hypothetical protein
LGENFERNFQRRSWPFDSRYANKSAIVPPLNCLRLRVKKRILYGVAALHRGARKRPFATPHGGRRGAYS